MWHFRISFGPLLVGDYQKFYREIFIAGFTCFDICTFRLQIIKHLSFLKHIFFSIFKDGRDLLVLRFSWWYFENLTTVWPDKQRNSAATWIFLNFVLIVVVDKRIMYLKKSTFYKLINVNLITSLYL